MYTVPKNAIFLIDGSALLYRAYYGLKPLQTSKGIPTQATYGFCRSIKKIIDDFDPCEMIVTWDSKGGTFRNEILTEYKAHRQAPPSDLFIQKEYIATFLDLIGLKQIAQQGYEADDLIAGLVEQFSDSPVVIVGPDKDLFQLLSERVVIFDPFKKHIIDQEEFLKKRGFASTKLPFFHALIGDSSDNIPGVKGIGDKTAIKLINEFGSLDDLYQNIDTVKEERVKKNLIAYKEDAYLSLKLFLLKFHRTGLKRDDIAFDKSKWLNAASFFKELEFGSFLKEMDEEATPLLTAEDAKKQKEWVCHIVKTEEALLELVNKLEQAKVFAFDTETTGLRPLMDKIVGISIAMDEQEAYYIPLGHKNRETQEVESQLPLSYVIDKLKPFFEKEQYEKLAQNAKFDELVLWNVGINVQGITFDTLLAASLLRKENQKIGLKTLSMQYLDEPMDTFQDIIGKDQTFEFVPIEKGARYAAHDALQTYKLTRVLQKELKKEKGLEDIFINIEMPFSEVLYEMEKRGILLDTQKIHHLAQTVQHKLSALEEKIKAALSHTNYHKHGEAINLNSPKQLEVLLFDELKLPVIKVSPKGQRSTDYDVLEELSKVHPIPGLIIQYRELFKLLSTYLLPLPEQVNPKTHRIHTSYSQTFVITGRLSSSDPNLQNIPASQGYGTTLREAFFAADDCVFISADYSQIEMRILAYLSQDEGLKDIFLHDKDIHTETAAHMFGVPLSEVTYDQRQIGKRVNFSVIYGITAYGLSQSLGVKPSEAKNYIEKFFSRYPRVAQWMESTIEQGKKDGYVTTVMGRRRYVPGLYERNKNLFQAACRIAVNSPVQGTQAELMKRAMINLYREFKGKNLNAHMILQIHDEVVLEIARNHLEQTKKILLDTMEGVVTWDVPLKVSLREGKDWGKITK